MEWYWLVYIAVVIALILGVAVHTFRGHIVAMFKRIGREKQS